MRRTNTGLLALTVVGGFFMWRNRFHIQEFLSRQGVDLSLGNQGVGDSVRSGLAKVKGTLEGGIDNINNTPNLNANKSVKIG